MIVSTAASAAARPFTGQRAAAAYAGLVACVVAVGAADVVVRRPGLLNLLAAAAVGAPLVLLALRAPRHAIVVTLAVLPFLALGRRVLILYTGGWHSKDPLLLVGPAVAFLIVAHHRSGVRGGRLSRLVGLLLALVLIETLNPEGGSLVGNVAGLLFVGVPLLWFFIGREFADRNLLATVLGVAVLASCVSATYGLSQSLRGLTTWDASWVAQSGYGSLYVGAQQVRAFGTFSSAAEYAGYLAAAVLVCVAASLHRRPQWLVLVPLLGTALFLEGSRGAFVLTIAATIAAIGLRTRHMLTAALMIALVSVVVSLGWHQYSGAAATGAQQSGNVAVQHQVGGLSHPLNTRQSTLVTHWHMFVNGIVDTVHHPFGLGTGATNLAGARFGGVQAQTEVDVSNMFAALGVVGGVVFVLVILRTLRQGFAVYRASGDWVALAALGVLLVSAGQWLNGGYYALAPLVWLIVGSLERAWLELRTEP